MPMRFCLLIFAMALGSITLHAQQDPFVGTWKTNPAKSKAFLGPASPPQLNRIESSGSNGIKYTTERTNAQGETSRTEFTANFDGKTYPFKQPTEARDGVAITQLDPYSYRVTYMCKGQPVQMNYWVVSKDGKTITTVTNGVDANGMYSRMMVLDKQ